MANSIGGKLIKGLIKWTFLAAIAGSIVLTLVGGGAFWYFSRTLPNIITMEDYRPAVVTQIIALPEGVPEPSAFPSVAPTKTEGKVAAKASPSPAVSPSMNAAEGAPKPTVIGEFYKFRRYLTPYEKFPEKLIQAVISAEDDQFFNHQGVNLASIIRAAIANFRAGHVVQGGSTITQQVAKSLLLTPERSFVRKAKELILASQIERNLKKENILYLYLNEIYLGHGSYGVQAAAKVYFDKDVSDLTVAEAAMIAGMPQAPGKFSPHLNPKKAKERQIYVLRRMLENRYLSQSEYDDAVNENLKVHGEVDVNPKYSPYFVETIRRIIVEKYGDRAVNEEGLRVYVNIDPKLLKAAGKSVREGLRAIDRRSGFRGPLKRYKKEEEMQKAIADARIQLVIDRLGYDVLLPDGTIDTIEAVKFAGMKQESDILQPGEIYPGIVTSLDAKTKVAHVNIGAVKVELPVEELKWAKAGVTQPAQVLAKGDLIQVRMLRREGDRIVVGLEQDTEIQGALFAMNGISGQVLAVEGGFDFSKSEFNRALQAQRQMGSAFKPMIFSAALEKGYTPASIIVDAPIVYNDEETGKWKPANFEEKFYGDTTFRQALIKSRNIPTIKIVQDVGIPSIIDFSKRIGIPTELPKDLSISLGSGTISLAEMTRAYAVYPRLGRKITPLYYSLVKDRDGKILEEVRAEPPRAIDDVMKMVASETPVAPPPPSTPEEEGVSNAVGTAESQMPRMPTYPLRGDSEQVVDPRVAYVTSHLMTEVVSFGTAHDAKALGKPAAGKTGTTNDYHDAWFVGFTPTLVAGAWVGYDSAKPIGKSETGGRAALPIWLEFMKEAAKNQPDVDFEVPPGVVFASIHPQTGKLAPPNASYAIKEAFLEGTEPKESGTIENGKALPARSTGDFLKEDIE